MATNVETHPVAVNLLRAIDCPHKPGWHQTASENVVFQDTEPAFGPAYEIARLVIVCTACGFVVEVRDVERGLT